jgi:uncharacterized protein YbbC (DUF1343 family)
MKRIIHAFVLFCLLLLTVPGRAATDQKTSTFRLGLEVLAAQHPQLVRGKRIAMLVGPTSLDQQFEHVIDRLSRAATIEVIFTGDPYFRPLSRGPEGTEKLDALSNAPVVEITDLLKRPSAADLRQAEVILVDIQDIGIRYFNYVTLLAQFLDLSRESGVPIVVLDRPNPLGGMCVSGPVLQSDFRSQFGVYPIPLVYGMTFGELALFFNRHFGLGAHLTVVGMEGYHRAMAFRQTGLHWMPPSDHLPEPESTAYYAMTGFLGEMGIFSTGVGTTRPFRFILAPWMDGEMVVHHLKKLNLPGVTFLPTHVRPYYGLFQQQRVPGIELIIADPAGFDPVLSGVAILKVLFQLYPNRIPLDNPGVSQGLDTLLGGPTDRQALMKGNTVFQIRHSWQPKLDEFKKARQLYLMYPDS